MSLAVIFDSRSAGDYQSLAKPKRPIGYLAPGYIALAVGAVVVNAAWIALCGYGAWRLVDWAL